MWFDHDTISSFPLWKPPFCFPYCSPFSKIPASGLSQPILLSEEGKFTPNLSLYDYLPGLPGAKLTSGTQAARGVWQGTGSVVYPLGIWLRNLRHGHALFSIPASPACGCGYGGDRVAGIKYGWGFARRVSWEEKETRGLYNRSAFSVGPWSLAGKEVVKIRWEVESKELDTGTNQSGV